MATDPGTPASGHLAGGQLSAAISNAMVRIHREYLGRGPTRARTSIRENMVVVLMEETLTKAERNLVADGKQDDVRRTRQTFQRTMRDDVVAAIEKLTGRTVIAFMSDIHIDPDLACEVIVLDPDAALEDVAGGPSET